MLSTAAKELEQPRRLERGLVRVRWFGVALGLYLVTQTNNTGFPPYASRTVLVLAYILMACLAVGNAAISFATGRIQSADGFRKLGLAAFLFDAIIIFASAWIYSYDPRGSTWVVIYILPLEGALRYQLGGALTVVALTWINEVAREAYLASRFDHPEPLLFIPKWQFQVANIAFRVGLQAIIAAVAGFMARSLATQRDKAAAQATRAEQVARRETAARRELAAFNTAVLTGVAAQDLDSSIQLMAGAIGRDLGYESLTIMLREEDHLVVKGMYGMPFYEGEIPLGEGVTGTVAATGRALIVADVSEFPGYIVADPEMRSEMAAPMKIGEEIVGVVDVESRTPDAFHDAALDVLTRLADQIALVAHSNLLLSQQRETMSRLQELDQMKSDFIAITSHELRTPITAIRGFVKTLLRNRERLTGEQIASFMTIIDRQSERLARLVEDLLFVSRIEAGAVRLQMEEVNFALFLKDVVDALTPQGRSRVWLDVDREAPPVVIDPHRTEQVLRNLIENALKFSPPDSQVFLTGTVEGDRIRVSVADQGVGIKEEEIPRIFERFHQAGAVMTRETEGAGLGLYISKRLVEAMNGGISVRSSAGEGTTFEVTLPARPVEEAPAVAEEAEHAPGTEPAAEPIAEGASADLNGQEPTAARNSLNEEIRSPS
jgi:signal transduction histidine kinase